MKARISVAEKFLSSNERRELKKEISKYADDVFKEREEKISNDLTRRIFKVMLASLYEEFGFGHERAFRAFKKFTETIKRSDKDEVYWEHIDRIVIDKLGLPFDRDYTDHEKAAG